MSTDLTIIGLKSITVNPVKTIADESLIDRFISYQRIIFHFHDGSKHSMSIHLDAGMHVFAIGEIVTNDKVSE
ncbi:hypothetical protein ACXX82_17280 [Glaciimonas sp. GNP009]